MGIGLRPKIATESYSPKLFVKFSPESCSPKAIILQNHYLIILQNCSGKFAKVAPQSGSTKLLRSPQSCGSSKLLFKAAVQSCSSKLLPKPAQKSCSPKLRFPAAASQSCSPSTAAKRLPQS
jgi:hypothetical protein